MISIPLLAPLLALIAAIPFAGWLIAVAVALVLTAVALIIFKIAAFTLMHLVFFTAGTYILLKIVSMRALKAKGKRENKQLAVLFTTSMLLIVLGVPNLFFSMAKIGVPRYTMMGSSVVGAGVNMFSDSTVMISVFFQTMVVLLAAFIIFSRDGG